MNFISLCISSKNYTQAEGRKRKKEGGKEGGGRGKQKEKGGKEKDRKMN